MPKRLHALLSQHDTVEHGVHGFIGVLRGLLIQDDKVRSARLCDPSVQHIGKLKSGLFGEGHNFCGYHNIQMQMSYVGQAPSQSGAVLESGIPSILVLQDLIEQAWAAGINAQGRTQTGGIRGTRRYIGTLEAQAVFKFLEIETKANVLVSRTDGASAFEQLLQFVDDHFTTEAMPGSTSKNVACTDRPPIFLQRVGHSVTIVGIETDQAGRRGLLMFDPAFAPRKQNGKVFAPSHLLKSFRYTNSDTSYFSGFETLHLVV